MCKYFVAGIAYDFNDCVTDYDMYFGEYETLEEAKSQFSDTISNLEANHSDMFAGRYESINYWMIQIEECECSDDVDECVDVIDDYYLYR